jgi:hypothetical protein
MIQKPDINTLSIHIDMDEYMYKQNYGVYKSNIASMFRMNAFTRVEVNGENKIDLELNLPTGLRPVIDESITKKDGKEYKNYYYSITYSIPNNYTLKGPSNEVLAQDRIGAISTGFTTYTYKNSTPFSSREECVKYYGELGRGNGEVKAAIASKVSEIINSVAGQVRNTIDYFPTSASERIFSIKSGKKGDFSAYDKASDQIIEAYKAVKVGENRNNFSIASAEPVAFWKSQLPSLDYNNKDQENIYTAATLNLAAVYYWQDKLDSAQHYLELAKLTNDKKGIIYESQRSVNQRKLVLKTCKEFNTDPYKAVGSADISEVNENTTAKLIEKILNDPNNFTKYSGQVIDRNGKLLNVTFKQYGTLNEEQVRRLSNQLVYKAEGSVQEVILNTSGAKYYDIDGSKYELVQFYPSTEVSATIQAMAKIIYDSPKIRVYEYDTKAVNDLAGTLNIIYKKPTEDIGTNTSSVKFLFMFKKALGKYFADCPAVKAKAESGGYGKGRMLLVSAAKEYAECK